MESFCRKWSWLPCFPVSFRRRNLSVRSRDSSLSVGRVVWSVKLSLQLESLETLSNSTETTPALTLETTKVRFGDLLQARSWNKRIYDFDFLAISEPQLIEIQQETSADPECPSISHPSYLKGLAKEERRSTNRTTPLQFNARDELTTQDGVFFKGLRYLIPTSLRRKMHTPLLKSVFAELEKLSIGPVCRLKFKMTSTSARFAPATRKSSPKNRRSNTRSQATTGKQLVLTFFTLTIETTSVLWITIQATLRSTPFKDN